MIEREKSGNEFNKEQDRLPAGHKLILAGPAFLLAFCMTTQESEQPALIIRKDIMYTVFNEYFSIHRLLLELVGEENLIVARTRLITGKHSSSGIRLDHIDLPQELGFGAVDVEFTKEHYRSWPRDGHTIVDGKVLTNAKAWNIHDERLIASGLGEGGKVLGAKNAILVTPDIWRDSKEELNKLRNKGFKIGSLPFVDPSKQVHDFKEDHSDGHASLIEDKNGGLVLLVADSYSHQGNGARKLIARGAETVGARMIEVDDRDLPPLALNLVQFADKSIAVTKTKTGSLEYLLESIVGEGKVFATNVPLEVIPESTTGGIRCLTNVIPPFVFDI